MRRKRDPSGRAAVPAVGARSWWLLEALHADAGELCPALAGEASADVCVVGGGFAGLWTAYELGERDPHLGIALVEADIVGAGGSGANGGFFSPSWAQLSGLCSSLGEEAGVAYAAALAAMVDELDGWIARHGARVDHWHEGILYARAGDWQPAPDEETFRLLGRHGYADRLRRVDAAAARAVADSPRFIGGVITPDLTVLQPGKLARELRRVLLGRGVRIFEHTPMVRVETGRPAPRRHAGRGGVRRQRRARAWRLGGAGAALPPRLRRVHRLHGGDRADPGADREHRLDLAHGRRRPAGDAVLPAAHRRRPHRHRRRRDGHRVRRAHPRPGAHVAAAGRGGRARPALAVPPARGRALRRRLERPDGHHRPGAALLRVGAGRQDPRRARLLRARAYRDQARRQDPRLAGARRRRRVEPHGRRRPSARAAAAGAASLAAGAVGEPGLRG